MNRKLSNIPFAPARFPIFYGWVVVVVGALGVLMSTPGQTMGVGPFKTHLVDALGLSGLQLSVAYMIGTGASGLILTFAGKAYDRWGARTVTTAACLGLAGMLVWCSFSPRLTGWLASLTSGNRTAWAFAVILVGFFGIRFCGQGVLTMVSRNMAMKWFDRHRGLANGVMGVGIALGMSSSPMVFSAFIDGVGWRGAWLGMAAIVGAGFPMIALLLYRDNPEDCGLVPDGSLHEDKHAIEAKLAHRQFTLGEAARTYAFWIFALGLGMFSLYMTALSFHVEDIFRGAGMDKDMAFSIFLPAAVIGVMFQFLVSWLSDYIPLKYLLLGMCAFMAASMVSLATLSEATRWILIVSNGLFGGIFGVLSAVTWPRFFGRTHLGAISGLFMSILVIASAIGPALYSLARRWSGSYAPASAGCAMVTGVLLVAAIFARNPQATIAPDAPTTD
jgi:MFS family permease